MECHITHNDLQDLLEQFLHQNPNGDTTDLAEFMYNKGFEAGEGGDNFRD